VVPRLAGQALVRLGGQGLRLLRAHLGCRRTTRGDSGDSFGHQVVGLGGAVGWPANKPQEATGRQAGRRLSGKDVGQVSDVVIQPSQPELRLRVESPHAGRLVVVEFIDYVESGGDSWCRVDIVPTDAQGCPVGVAHQTVLASVEDELAYARYNTQAAIRGKHVVRLVCAPPPRR
jgi:hypothetical protein